MLELAPLVCAKMVPATASASKNTPRKAIRFEMVILSMGNPFLKLTALVAYVCQGWSNTPVVSVLVSPWQYMCKITHICFCRLPCGFYPFLKSERETE